jgi:hypothetical protein
MISAVNLQRKFILILMFLGGQFSGGKVVSFQAEKTNSAVNFLFSFFIFTPEVIYT